MARFTDLPPEILHLITRLIYLDHLPRSLFRCIDPHGLPSTYHDARLISSTQAAVQASLYALCLVNRACYHAARPLLFRRLQITLPYSFLLLLRSLGAALLADAYEHALHPNQGTPLPLPTQLRPPEDARHQGMSTSEDDSLSDAAATTATEDEGEDHAGDDDDDANALAQQPVNSTLQLSRVPHVQPPPRPPPSKRLRGTPQQDQQTRQSRAQMSFTAIMAAAGFARATGSKLYVSARRGDKLRQRANEVAAAASATSRRSTSAERNPVHSRYSANSDEEGDAAMQLVWTEEASDVPSRGRYSLTLQPSQSSVSSEVHHYPRVLDFSTFTSQGLRRAVGEGETARFVTPSKLLALITACDGLMAFGASHTMDSALSKQVLEALLFRDGKLAPPSRLRGVSVERPRRDRSVRRLESLDLCGCVSPKFQEALSAFVDEHLRKFSGRHTDTVAEESEEASTTATSADEDGDERGRGRARSTQGGRFGVSGGGPSSSSRSITRTRSKSTQRGNDDEAPSVHPARATRFPSLQRLGLASLTFPVELVAPFVLAFPRLTHLDLSSTRTDAALLKALGASSTVRLESLSLARCKFITSEALTDLLVDSPVTAELVELSLEGTLIFPTPLTAEDLQTIIEGSPALRSGRMRYLDLGGCGMTDAHLSRFRAQPSLIDLGLASTPEVSPESLAQFLIRKAPNVQVLELSDSCAAVGQPLSPLHLNAALLQPCTGVPPLTLSQQIALMGIRSGGGGGGGSDDAATGSDVEAASHAAPPPPPPPQPATNLRVVGLSPAALRAWGGGMGAWKVIWGAGRRGWLVDTSAGPNPEALDEELAAPDEAEDEEAVGARGVGSGEGALGRRAPRRGQGQPDEGGHDGEGGGDDDDHDEQLGRRGRSATSLARSRLALSPQRTRDVSRGRSTSRHRIGATAGATSLASKYAAQSAARQGWQPESPPVRSPALSPSPSARHRKPLPTMAAGAPSGSGVGMGASSSTSTPSSALRRAASLSRASSRSGSGSPATTETGTLARDAERGLLQAGQESGHADAVVRQRGGEATPTGPQGATAANETRGAGSAATTSSASAAAATSLARPNQVVRGLPPEHARCRALRALADAHGHVPSTTGWHSRKAEVLFGFGLLGRQAGAYAYWAYQT